ncbi:putative ATP-binding protein [Octadecabacter arcticus 238]|uniref:Putative ATP-binding protein n=1 Tax=Octadecabacter arcticus 238 TaxID=391616 RepID=M9RI96_9RHOB|nr:ATP-binding protein [Octadecabacter arcticus]AGI71912.1 putative ATP-binding protein [Octadecabacter arcticus 238]
MGASLTRNSPPQAGMLIESLRGLGYTTATALADIIDNAIPAGATQVNVLFHWAEGDSWISVADNGKGMSDDELERAMQLGARDPRDERLSDDLGRFGMGLKTASFSQARTLTVASRPAKSEFNCLRWDLDALENTASGDWPLLEGAAHGSLERLKLPDGSLSGTVVLWEKLDRIITDGFSGDDMMELMEQVEAHLGMTFHRIIGKAAGQFELTINEKRIVPWDPFMLGHLGKRLESTEYRLVGAPDVKVQCHVLPHKDMLGHDEAKVAAGPEGWSSQQGFYIYRNKRLLTIAGWLRLGERGRQWTKDEPHRLARIRLDIPNNVDGDWKINVIKSTASPPVKLKPQLHRIAKETRETARSVFAYRGRLVEGQNGREGAVPDIWQAIRKTSGATSYRLSREHDLYRSVIGRAGPLKKDIEALLRLVEGTVPVQRIWLDTAEADEPPVSNIDDEPDPILIDTMEAVFDALVHSSGLSEDEARARLSKTRPFDKRPELVSQLKIKN